jgi:hypothetical protein
VFKGALGALGIVEMDFVARIKWMSKIHQEENFFTWVLELCTALHSTSL